MGNPVFRQNASPRYPHVPQHDEFAYYLEMKLSLLNPGANYDKHGRYKNVYDEEGRFVQPQGRGDWLNRMPYYRD